MTDQKPMPEVDIEGAFILNVFTQRNDMEGVREFTGVVLCRPFAGVVHEFVVWDMWYDEEVQRWQCGNGHYFDVLEQARYMFGRQLLRNCWGAIVRGLRDA